MPAKKKASAAGATRRRRWWQLRMLWSMLGVFEINQDHDFYDLACFIKTGLRTALTDAPDPPPLEQLTADCFKKQETQVHEGFQMQTFSGPVFSSLRRSLGLSEEEYRSSLSSEEFYLQFISNSKSKADFFITHDKRFFLKTQSHREVKFLLSNLPLYVDHLNRYPHSLLVRFLGVHKIIVPNHTKKYFIIMQSVFFPDDRISSRYDIKGCELGRWTAPAPQGSPVISVLKDNNFQGQIILGSERSWFEEQVELDSAFLRSLNVLDYSLLIGQQALHRDELDQRHSLATLVNRTTKSLDLDEGHGAPPSRPLLERQRSLEEEQNSGVPGGGGVPLGILPSGGAEGEFHARHRRLLPDFQNAVHVLDGPQRRYFVGIIDVFTQYGWRKRLEHWYKALRFPGRSFSTVSPHAYSLRLCQWVRSRTQ